MILLILFFLLLIIGMIFLLFVLLDDNDQHLIEKEKILKDRKVNIDDKNRNNSIKEPFYLKNIGVIYHLEDFVVNLKTQDQNRFLKTIINLELSTNKMIFELDKNNPVIRDKIIKILSSKTFDEIYSSKGKEKLENEIIETLNRITTDGVIVNVYFSDFIIQ